jgi:hypothetical protein
VWLLFPVGFGYVEHEVVLVVLDQHRRGNGSHAMGGSVQGEVEGSGTVEIWVEQCVQRPGLEPQVCCLFEGVVRLKSVGLQVLTFE